MIKIKNKAVSSILLESLKGFGEISVLELRGVPEYIDIAKPVAQIEIVCDVIYARDVVLSKLAKKMFHELNEAFESMFSGNLSKVNVSITFSNIIVPNGAK